MELSNPSFGLNQLKNNKKLSKNNKNILTFNKCNGIIWEKVDIIAFLI